MASAVCAVTTPRARSLLFYKFTLNTMGCPYSLSLLQRALTLSFLVVSIEQGLFVGRVLKYQTLLAFVCTSQVRMVASPRSSPSASFP